MELNESQLEKITAGTNPNNVEHIERQNVIIKGFSEKHLKMMLLLN